MRRRAVFAVLALGLLGLVAAVIPWTLSSDSLRAAVADRVRDAYGLELTVEGRSVVALLPVPRVKFETVALASPDGSRIVRAGLLRAELRLLPLLLGRTEPVEILLLHPKVDVAIDEAERSPWDATLARLGERLGQNEAGPVGRLILVGGEVRINHRRSGLDTALSDVNLEASWPSAAAPAEVSGSLAWRGQPIQLLRASLDPGALLSARAGRIDLDARAPLGRLTVTGDLRRAGSARLLGRTAFETRSLAEFARWSGLDLPLGHLVQAFALEGAVEGDGDIVSWPSARLTLGGDRLEGALSLRREGGRRILSGTLAANRLDLTGFATPFLRTRTPTASGWSTDEIPLQAPGVADLDLRLSAASSRIGSLRIDDMAANVSVKPGRYEVAVGRASINKGAVKGRAVLASADDGVEIKAQGSFDGLDMASLLTDLGTTRWLGGLAQGQVTIEGWGDSPADIVRHLHGRASVSVQNGELSGIVVGDPARRKAKGPAIALGRGERTPFGQAHVNIVVTDGTAEIADSELTASGVRAALRGRASLSERTWIARADVESTGVPAAAVEIRGPWSRPTIAPVMPKHEPETTGSGRIPGQ